MLKSRMSCEINPQRALAILSQEPITRGIHTYQRKIRTGDGFEYNKIRKARKFPPPRQPFILNAFYNRVEFQIHIPQLLYSSVGRIADEMSSYCEFGIEERVR